MSRFYGTLTHPVIRIPIDKHLATTFPTHVRSHLLEFPRRARSLDFDRFHRDLVPEQPGRVLPPPQHEFRIRLLRPNDGVFDLRVDRRFNRAHEPCPHVDPFRAEAQRCRQPLPVGEAARGDEGHRERLPRSAQQDEVSDIRFADVTCAFEAVDGEEVDAEFDGRLRVSDGGAFVEDGAVGGFELLDYGARAVTGGFDDPDAFVDDRLSVAVVVWRDESGEEGQVDSEWILGHGSTSSNLLPKIVRGGLCEGGELRSD